MKLPGFPIEIMLRRIEAAIAQYPKAAMFSLREQGYNSLFEQLVSCIISIRTLDETTIPVSLRLFEKARTPEAMLALGREPLADLLFGSTFPGQKADTIRAISEAAIANGGAVPQTFEALTALKGVGPKCANLALGVALGVPAISVDVHVHRVVNRWGLVQTSTPEKTLLALEKIVPQNLWIDINRDLMPFGKFHCTAHLPKCSSCPVAEWCQRMGVTKHR